MEEYPEIDVKLLIPHPDNPKEHDDEQIKEIADSIKAHGWGRPLIISSDYYILAGEGAYLAAINILKLKKVPYKFLEPKRKHDEPEAISYMLADNRIAEKSNWNNAKLEINFKVLKKKRWNTKLTGFKDTSAEKLKLAAKPRTGLSTPGGENEFPEGYKKPEFDDLIDKYKDEKGKSDKNEQWFYVEFYKDPDKFKELQELLSQYIVEGKHELDGDWFYNLIKGKL